ncbi:hypothetical protein GUITHDRAFT_142581 [Guillardia theta CCMP2712]|uniref:Uncharacterized protein n=1 Tax=Guillardia theta (strain CCMP2712) TaxID=905079 RepID=L1IWU7_GUITC|nr:hypothetical protein GUITHDRAFT_142581 [Guillardia theta CCMP2712]EKX40716.1 hypothetical protein GUITHDRAFT_142581 [Guillardia theta CCMP2712]|eukprot:XP_005827696.1 hypothetical protein GUITHDRAFT_142581 [Guillardia theta CCMP2712]
MDLVFAKCVSKFMLDVTKVICAEYLYRYDDMRATVQSLGVLYRAWKNLSPSKKLTNRYALRLIESELQTLTIYFDEEHIRDVYMMTRGMYIEGQLPDQVLELLEGAKYENANVEVESLTRTITGRDVEFRYFMDLLEELRGTSLHLYREVLRATFVEDGGCTLDRQNLPEGQTSYICFQLSRICGSGLDEDHAARIFYSLLIMIASTYATDLVYMMREEHKLARCDTLCELVDNIKTI